MSVAADLADLLSTITGPGDFVTSGSVELLAPSISVDGVGRIALPLLPVQAEALVGVAERAPYGRGPETLTDTSVRRTWQIAPEHVHIEGRHWARTLQDIVARAAEGLGIKDPVTAEFYKLLVYDKGSFFVGHRDTEKSPGMFATLVIVLPSESAGGELLVRHKDREVRLPLRCDDPSDAAFAAFYADCVHEVLPVTTGCRLTLVYNLLRHGRGRLPRPPDYVPQQQRLIDRLQEWRAELATSAAPVRRRAAHDADESDDDDEYDETFEDSDEHLDDEEYLDDDDEYTGDDDSEAAAEPSAWDAADGPAQKLVYPLEHAYTQAELGFSALKGADAGVAQVLAAVAPQAGCTLHLALLTVTETGNADYNEDFYYRRRRSTADANDEFVAGDVEDRWIALSNWRTADGSASSLTDLPVFDEEIAPPDAFEGLDPDEEHFEEATGNAGASFERTYRRAALVLWPSDRIFAVLAQAGISVTLPYLDDLVSRWEHTGADRASPLWADAHALAGHMITDWPKPEWYQDQGKADTTQARMLRLLVRLGDAERAEAMLTQVIAAGVHGRGDTGAVIDALALLPAPAAIVAIERIVSGTAHRTVAACAELLARRAASGDAAALRNAARRLLDALPGDPARSARNLFSRRMTVDPDLVVSLLRGLTVIDTRLAARALDFMRAWPQTYQIDNVLVPAACALHEAGATGDAISRLHAAVVAHLSDRAAEELVPPPDWRRDAKLTCNCPRCRELAAFLVDPGQRVWMLRAVEAERGHVEATIQHAKCDVDARTQKQGRPYTLVCTKNQASYERRVEQRRQDLANLAALEA